MFSANDDNPFRTHRHLLSHIMSLRDETSSDGQFNRHFKEKPTEAMIIDHLDLMEIRADESVVLRKQRLARKRYGDLECYHITLSFDKKPLEDDYNHYKVKECMMSFLSNFQGTNYKWSIDPIAVCEFHTDSGFNPHIHMIIKKNYENNTVKTPSQIQQVLRRKYILNKALQPVCGIYSINVKKLPISKGEDYVNGLKQDGKLDNVEKDKRYRQRRGYKDLYYVSEFDYNM